MSRGWFSTGSKMVCVTATKTGWSLRAAPVLCYAVNQFLNSVVQEIRTLRCVGGPEAGDRSPPPRGTGKTAQFSVPFSENGFASCIGLSLLKARLKFRAILLSCFCFNRLITLYPKSTALKILCMSLE